MLQTSRNAELQQNGESLKSSLRNAAVSSKLPTMKWQQQRQKQQKKSGWHCKKIERHCMVVPFAHPLPEKFSPLPVNANYL